MVGLVLRALWRRRTPTVLLFLLAVIASTGAAAAPAYILGSIQSLAAGAVPGADPAERVVAVRGQRPQGPDPAADLAAFTTEVSRELDLRGFTPVAGAELTAAIGPVSGFLNYRDGVCAHVAIMGACPVQAGEVLVAAELAAELNLVVGGEIPARVGTVTVPLRITGTYRPNERGEGFWGRPGPGSLRVGEQFAFTPLATYPLLRPPTMTYTLDLEATPAAFRDRDPQLHALAYELGAARLANRTITATSDLRALADRIFDEQQLVIVGVGIAAGELLLMCWFALYLAVAQTGPDRRADVGLLKMRGVRGRDIWILVTGQSLVPLVAGGVVGLIVGPRLAQSQTGAVASADVLLAVAATSGVAVLGATIAALVAEGRTLRESVASLNRRVARVRRGWRTSLVDGVIAVLAVAAAYQVQTDVSGRGVGLAAPILLTLAVGLLAARLVPLVAGRVGAAALRAGRLGPGLVALHLARRPGTARVLGLLVVAAAVLCGTMVSWSTAANAHHERAVFEVGSDRVVRVTAPSVAALVRAVRAADPLGRYAMAAVQLNRTVPVLAVDSRRLDVVPLLPSYGVPDPRGLAEALHPAAPAPVRLAGAGKSMMDITWSSSIMDEGRSPLSMEATFAGTDAALTTVSFGPLRSGRHSYLGPAAGCPGECRLVSLALRSGPAGALPPSGSAVTIHAFGLTEDATLLTDRTRWRADVGPGPQLPQLTAGPAGLTLTVTDRTLLVGARLNIAAYVLDAPTPLPVVTAGAVDLGGVADPRLALTDPVALPVRVVGQATALPRTGSGVLVDLEYAAVAGAHAEGAMQVWLNADAPPGFIDRLTAEELTVVTVESVADREAVLAGQGPAVALRFLVLVAFVGVLLAVVSFAVMTAVERRARRIELAALRRQGLRPGVVRQVGAAGYAALVLVAVALGAGTAVGLAVVAPSPLPVFGDGWQVLGPPGAGRAVLPGAAAAFALALGVVATVGAVSLIGGTRRELRRELQGGER